MEADRKQMSDVLLPSRALHELHHCLGGPSARLLTRGRMAFWEEWVDVSNTDVINRYALFLGYLAMAARGLGFLVVTWTTVVLLGGSVSVLGQKDFWCLTVITLVQILGVFDFLFKEKASDIVNALMGLVAAVRAVIVRKEGTSIIVLSVVQMLGFAIALCPLVLLYLLGLYISTGISLWRLMEHDYGNIDGAPNLKPALNVLYSLAVAQGVVFSYKTMYDFVARTGVTERMAAPFKLDEDLVSGYLDQTVTGCIKDPSFAKGRNLITYAADLLMEPKSTDDYLSGVQILGTILQVNKPWWNKQLALLTGSASFKHVIQRLLEILRPGSPYGTEIRKHAASAVVHVADCILLEQIPGGIQLISTLLDTFEEYSWRCEVYNRGRLQEEEEFERRYRMYMPDFLRLEEPLSDSNRRLHEYKWFVVQGLRILQKLAVHEGNCRVISHTGGLLSKTMAPLISEQLHRDVHDEWCSMAEESVELMRRLMAAPGETGEKLQLEISRNLEAAISRVKSFLECPKCSVLLKRHAVKVLLDLSVDTSSIIASGRRSMMFSWILLHIFVLPDDRFGMNYASMHWVKRSSHIRRLAGEKLLAMLSTQSEGSSTNMLQAFRVVFTSLTRTIVQARNDAYSRVHAAHIVNDLCYFYTEHDELYTRHDKFLEELKEAITNIMPEVLEEILRCGSTSAELHVRAEANKDQVSAQGTYIEGVVPQGNCQDNASSSQWQNRKQYEAAEEVRETLISLCGKMPHGWACQLDEIAAKTCSDQGIPVKDFRSLVQYADNLLKEEKANRLANAPASSFK